MFALHFSVPIGGSAICQVGGRAITFFFLSKLPEQENARVACQHASRMGGTISALITNVVGVAYPAYASFKALETPEEGDDRQWTTYWIIYGAFSLVEVFADLLVSWFPFYFPFKLLFLIALQWPKLNLAGTIYTTYLLPYLKTHEATIDANIAHAGQALKDKTGKIIQDNAAVMGQYIMNALPREGPGAPTDAKAK